MYKIFYRLISFSGDDDLWIKFLDPLIFVALGFGVLLACLFVFTRTGTSNARVQNRYWFVLYLIGIVLTTITLVMIKGSTEDSDPEGKFSIDLGSFIMTVVLTVLYVGVIYYILTNILRRAPRHNPKRYFPTFVLPHASKLNPK
ncbi:hypothetical protein [Niastella sp. OAS944]|jgi:uncharacterized membrane protein|uniref:hypothetical protein n=1 Tax=Niastella sp. OAS944 TaxID=2664089 RepID=UPI00347DED61|nr:putative membrane protein [Chitinophagaceae bacterium OAS944]